MRFGFIALLTLVFSLSAFSSEVCTVTSIGGKVGIGCSNINNGIAFNTSINLTVALKEKLDDGFKIQSTVAVSNATLIIIYTLVKD